VRCALDQRAPASQAASLEPAHHERIVAHRSWMFEYVFQLGIVLVGRAPEARPDQLVSALIELPPRPFEIEHVTLAVGQFFVRQVHGNSLTRRGAEVEDGKYVRLS
jgi:hypothetical protein